MKRDEFLQLSEPEQTAFLEAQENDAQTISEVTAERDSLRAENEELRTADAERAEELRKTKELNYTLARKITAEHGTRKPDEQLINEMFL